MELTAVRTLEGEAGNQPEATQRAVVHVMVNRLKSGRWGYDLTSVCLWFEQFSCWGDYNDNTRICKIRASSLLLTKYAEYIDDALKGEPDPTRGAMWYKNTSLAWPAAWGTEVPPTLVSGALSFYILRDGVRAPCYSAHILTLTA
jgi:hypothetical protein